MLLSNQKTYKIEENYDLSKFPNDVLPFFYEEVEPYKVVEEEPWWSVISSYSSNYVTFTSSARFYGGWRSNEVEPIKPKKQFVKKKKEKEPDDEYTIEQKKLQKKHYQHAKFQTKNYGNRSLFNRR